MLCMPMPTACAAATLLALRSHTISTGPCIPRAPQEDPGYEEAWHIARQGREMRKGKRMSAPCKSCGFWAKGFCDLYHRKQDPNAPVCPYWETRDVKKGSCICGRVTGTDLADKQYHGVSSDLLDNRNYGG